jgi:hypothetical protein
LTVSLGGSWPDASGCTLNAWRRFTIVATCDLVARVVVLVIARWVLVSVMFGTDVRGHVDVDGKKC